MKHWRIPITYLAILLVQWGAFLLLDWLDEARIVTDLPQTVGWLLLALLAAFWALVGWSTARLRSSWVRLPRWGFYPLCMLLWTALNLGLFWLIWTTQPVYQHTEGWDNFLNGIEYPFFAVFNLAPVLILLLMLLVGGLRSWLRRRAENHTTQQGDTYDRD